MRKFGIFCLGMLVVINNGLNPSIAATTACTYGGVAADVNSGMSEHRLGRITVETNLTCNAKTDTSGTYEILDGCQIVARALTLCHPTASTSPMAILRTLEIEISEELDFEGPYCYCQLYAIGRVSADDATRRTDRRIWFAVPYNATGGTMSYGTYANCITRCPGYCIQYLLNNPRYFPTMLNTNLNATIDDVI